MSVYKKNNYRPGRQTKKEREQEEPTKELTSEQLSHESTTAEVFQTLDEKAGKTEAWVQRNQRSILLTVVCYINNLYPLHVRLRPTKNCPLPLLYLMKLSMLLQQHSAILYLLFLSMGIRVMEDFCK